MKNLKLLVAAFMLFSAVLVSKATECPEDSKNLSQTMNIQNSLHVPANMLLAEGCVPDNAMSTIDFASIEEYESFNQEDDALFDFNQENYLPLNFNAYSEDEAILAAHELLNVEEDEPFDFDVKDYISENTYVSK